MLAETSSMPFAGKRRVTNEKKNKECATKCQKINFFFKHSNDHGICESANMEVATPEPAMEPRENPQTEVAVGGTSQYNTMPMEAERKKDYLETEEPINQVAGDKVAPQETNLVAKHQQVLFYKGFELDIKSIIRKAGEDILSLFQERVPSGSKSKLKTRTLVKCLVCDEFEEEAKQFSSNKKVYMAHGVRCDGKKKLQDVVDHLHGTPHAAAMERRTLTR